MKTSNKILIALFVLPFLAATIVVFTFYATYKSGKFVTEAVYNKRIIRAENLTSFAHINLLNYKGGNVRIEKNEYYSIGIDENNIGKVSYAVKNNTLEISSAANEMRPVTIFCPEFSSLTTDSSLVNIQEGFKSIIVNAKSRSDVYIDNNLDSLTLNIERDGHVNLLNSNIKKLNLNLSNGSGLNVSDATVFQFGNVYIEDSTQINMSGKAMRGLLRPTIKE